MTERDIRQLLRKGLDAGTDAYRQDLLRRCLDVLADADKAVPLSDEDLADLAAAGLAVPPEDPDDDLC